MLGLVLAAHTALKSPDDVITTADHTPAATPSSPTTSPTPNPTPAPSPDLTSPSRVASTNRSPTRPTPSRPDSPRTAAEWVTTLRALDAQRAQAFRTLDAATLDQIYVPGSPPWRSDRTLLATYRKQNIRIHNLRIQIDKTTITHQTPTTVTLRTTDRLVAGQAVDGSGTTAPLPPGAPATHLITLTRTPSSWRISTITPA